jgi:large subunit ribosomal protein L6
MSRLGKKTIQIPSGVSLTTDGRTVTAKGPKGELNVELPSILGARVDKGEMHLLRNDDGKDSSRLQGLHRAIIANMVEGVSKGFRKDLEIQGVGFKASLQGRKLVLSLGFSSPIEYEVPQGITLTVDSPTTLGIAGADKQSVGNVAARIRGYYPAEPYKGKGVRYKGEHVRRKVGKTVA